MRRIDRDHRRPSTDKFRDEATATPLTDASQRLGDTVRGHRTPARRPSACRCHLWLPLPAGEQGDAQGRAHRGCRPSEENAYAGKYPGTRRLYLYVNKARLGAIRGLRGLGTEYLSSAALGPGGYLIKAGFVPLPIDGMVKAMAVVRKMPPLRREMLD